MSVRLSFSALEKYNTCNKLYKYHYIDRIRSTRQSSALLFGNAIDEALNVLLKEKDVERSFDKYNELMRLWKYNDNIDFFKSDYSKTEQVSPWTNIYNKGFKFIEKYINEVLPLIEEVVDVQTKIEKTNQHGDSIIGYIDILIKWKDTDYISVVDNKTSSKSYSKKMIQTSRQLALYSWALDHKNVSYVVLRKDLNSKGDIRPIQLLHHEIDKELVDEVLGEFDIALNGIKNKEFDKTNDRNTCKYMFGKPCPYFDLCYNGKSLEDCENLEKK